MAPTIDAVDSAQVKEMVRSFLAQGNVVYDVRVLTLEDHIWTAEAEVSLYGITRIKRVKVDAETGRILGYTSLKL
ncbi:MAG: hypothetical protein ACREBI_03850 [Nitrosotalea sp.]